jgi:hypothetical protein
MTINIDPAQFSSNILSHGADAALAFWMEKMFPESIFIVTYGTINVNGQYTIDIPEEYYSRIKSGELFDCGEDINLEVENPHLIFKPYLKTETCISGCLVKICFPKSGKKAKFYCKFGYGKDIERSCVKFYLDIENFALPTIQEFGDYSLHEAFTPFIEKSFKYYKLIRDDLVINKSIINSI